MTLDERPWKVGHAVLVVAAGLAASVAAAVLLGPDLTAQEVWRVVLPVQTMAQILVVAALAARSASRRAALGPGFEASDLAGLPVGAALLVGGSLALTGVSELFLDGRRPTQEVVELASEVGGVDVALVVVWAGLLGPLAEELAFRGVLLRALLARRGPTFAITVSSAAFAGLHLLDPQAWMVVPLLFALGVVMARQAVATGRLARPFLTHAGFNLVSVAALFVAVE